MAALAVVLVASGAAEAGPVGVRYTEGVTHGLLELRSADGVVLAEGDLLQVVRDEGVESRLVFRFRDGSLHDETVVFSQQRVFALRRYRLEQRGPSFPAVVQLSVERATGRYQVSSRRDGGEAETASGEVELPPDVYNGMLIVLLRNLPKGAAETVHVLAFTPKPAMIQIEMTPLGEETVRAGDRGVPATHYVLKPKLGLLRGAAAALLGKTPPDYHAWIVTAGAPAFVAIDGPLYNSGPIWRIETVSPRGPARAPATSGR
ncbi:MAG: hypothetical protein ACRELW_06605 [Candidatus Rokuibacteriota bacterium]